jgi:hypothetical protein
MVMGSHDVALAIAGSIGSSVAIVHGVLVQGLLVKPFAELAATRLPAMRTRLLGGLLHFSTFNWFLSGLALLASAFASEQQVKLAVGLFAGSSFLYGALGNLWATRRPHPGWILYGAALLLIAYGLAGAEAGF